MNILAQIVESKKREIEALYKRYSVSQLAESFIPEKSGLENATPKFYQRLAEARAAGQPFFITEFKRKSPSEGWINRNADLPAQVRAYAEAGTGAISVLTDEPFFGGRYEDLKRAKQTLDSERNTVNPIPSAVYRPPLLLQKDFILDPLQIYLAKHYGADIILLIAAILEPERLGFLRRIAESIGLGVLAEVHDAEELEKIQHLDFPVLGINNRDLKTFRTSLNRANVLKKKANGRFVVAESGVLDYRHFQMVRSADGFLIGTGLMRDRQADLQNRLIEHFQTQGRFLFKACGIRTKETIEKLGDVMTQNHRLTGNQPDFIGINFSPASKRRADTETCEAFKTSGFSGTLVAVFYKNSETEIREILKEYPFKTVQLYAGDVSPEFVRSLKVRVILAVKISHSLPWSETMTTLVEPYAADVDCFILDGANPGSGARIKAEIPADFPYPFLLAGGLREENLEAVLQYKNCIGVDIASGIETNGEVDMEKIKRIAGKVSVSSFKFSSSKS